MATKKKSTELANANKNLPSLGVDMGGYADAGLQQADQDSFAIPFLSVLQKMSPEVDEDDPAFVEGAKPGMLYNNVTQTLYDGKDGVIVLPCEFQRQFIRWGNREGGEGGFKGVFEPEQAADLQQSGDVINIDGRWYFPDENGNVDIKKSDILQDTRNHFCILVDPVSGMAQEVLISLKSTQIKKSKVLVSNLKSVKVATADGGKVTPPTWVNKVALTTLPEKNDQGSWHGVKFTMTGEFVETQDLFDAGREFYEAVKSGEANVNYDNDAEQKVGPSGGQF